MVSVLMTVGATQRMSESKSRREAGEEALRVAVLREI